MAPRTRGATKSEAPKSPQPHRSSKPKYRPKVKTTHEGDKRHRRVRSCFFFNEDHHLYINPEAKFRFMDNYAKRKVIKQRPVNLDFFRMQGIEAFQKLQQIGWTPFLEIHEEVYPRLVRLFYANLTEDIKNGVLRTHVLGTPISFNDDKINAWLGLDYSDCEKIFFTHKCTCPEFNYEGFLQEVTGVPPELCPDAGRLLTPNYRIFIHFFTHVVMPKYGKQNLITMFSLFLMWSALNGRKVNLGYIIFQVMASVLKRATCHLPYGMVITKILKASGVKIPPNEQTMKTTKKSAYDEPWMKHMHFTKVKGRWVRHGDDEERTEMARFSPRNTAAPFNSDQVCVDVPHTSAYGDHPCTSPPSDIRQPQSSPANNAYQPQNSAPASNSENANFKYLSNALATNTMKIMQLEQKVDCVLANQQQIKASQQQIQATLFDILKKVS